MICRPRQLLLAFIGAVTLFLAPSCTQTTQHAQTLPRKERPVVPSDIDANEINDTAHFLAGMDGRADGPYHGYEASPAWQSYKSNFDETWKRVSEQQLEPVAAFKERALEDEASRFVFYPFSGPDVLYMTRFFPGRDVYVMAGLERVGHLPHPGEYSDANVPVHLTSWGTALNSIFRRSFFVTSEMSRQLHGEISDGLLPIITVLLARSGYTIDGVQLGKLGVNGVWEKPSVARPRGVRVDFHMGEGNEQTLYYFSTDLAAGFGTHTPFVDFLGHLGHPETFLKSASFLPHLKEFTNLRNYVLTESTRIVQDDTGIPYLALIDHGWQVHLFGEYSRPDPPFRPRYQPELAAAFADPAKVAPLGFSIGYGYNRRPSSLLVALQSNPRN